MPRVYLSYAAEDREDISHCHSQLVAAGFTVYWDEDLPLGTPWKEELARWLKASDVILVFLSRASLASTNIEQEVLLASQHKKTIIPIFLSREVLRAGFPGELRALRDLQGVDLDRPGGIERLIAGLRKLGQDPPAVMRGADVPLDFSPAPAPVASWVVEHVALRNVRCFASLDLDLTGEGEPILLTMLLGNNAAGKSTLLRSLALGLCGESDASALLKQTSGPFVRRGAQEARIELKLRDLHSPRKAVLTTQVLLGNSNDELVRKETEPTPFPWDELFVCGYGTNRTRQASASYEGFSLHQALRPLFDDAAVLQNPEVVLLRQTPFLRAELERRLLHVLMLDQAGYELSYARSGPEIHGPWGDQALRDLSDGYRSTTQWVLDFLGWAIQAGRFGAGGSVGGILLLDELEQHLHPRWQRHVVQRLRSQLPGTQIFTSTHTPLTAGGVADVDAALLLRLKTGADGAVEAIRLDPRDLAGQRADQILASEAFGLPTSRNPGSAGDLSRYAELLGKGQPSEAETAELRQLEARLDTALKAGESAVEREVEQAVDSVLQQRLRSFDPKLLDFTAKNQLRELFGKTKPS